MRRSSSWSVISLGLCGLLAGCGGGAAVVEDPAPAPASEEESGPRPLPTPYPDPLLNKLYALGVPLEATDSPRVESDGTVRSADYMPLGSTVVTLRPPEFLAAGFRMVRPEGGLLEDGSLFERLPAGDTFPARTSLVHTPEDRRWVSSPLRRSAGVDLQGDGVEEAVIVHRPTGGSLTIEALGLTNGIFGRSLYHEVSQIAGNTIRDLDIAAGDVDGDDREELLVAVSFTGGTARLLFFSLTPEGLVEHVDWAKTWSAGTAGHDLGVLVKSGNSDDDHGCEVGVVLNESWKQSGLDKGAATYRIYDDASANFAERASGPVSLVTNLLGGGDKTISAVYANLAFFDADGDRVAEVVLAGLMLFKPENQDQSNYTLLIALEDGNGGYVRTSDHATSLVFEPIGNEENHEFRVIRHVWIEPLNWDVDGRDELLVNHLLYDNFADKAPWTVIRDLGADTFLPAATAYPLSRRTCAVAVGDLDSDGKDEVLHIAPRPGTGDHIDVWHETLAAERINVGALPDNLTTDSGVDLMFVAMDVDGDGTVLQSVTGSHLVVYSEPIVLAALAAPPSKFDIGQNLDACATSYGRSASVSRTHEFGLLQKFGGAIGTKASALGGNLEIETKWELEIELKETRGFTSTTTVSTTYTTGPLEDTVIFTTLPYDRYEYRVLHHKQASMINTRYYVMQPREAVTLMVQREFFNYVTGDDSVKIDNRVFPHTIGDPTTYRSRAQKDQIMAQATSSHPAFQNGAQRVGQGTGSVELGLAIGKETSSGFEAEIMVSRSWEFSAGVTVELSVGFGAGYSLSLSRGNEMSYVGTVGNIDAEHFVDEQYSFGLFTHYHTDAASGQTFEVVDYWVED